MATLSADAIRMLEALPEAGVWCNGDLIQVANAGAVSVLGEPAESLAGRSIWDFVHAEDQDRIRARYRDRLTGKPVPSSYELDLARKDGTRIRVEIVPRPVTPGNEMLIVLRDLRSQAQDARLVVALSEVSEQVQRSRSVEAALDLAIEGMRRCGIAMHVSRLQDQTLVPIRVPNADPMVREMERVLGKPWIGAAIPLALLPHPERLLEEHHGLYLDDLLGAMIAFLSQMPKAGGVPGAVPLIAPVPGYGRGVLAPVVVEGRTWGILLFASERLTRADAAALELFTAQMSSALEVVEAIERLQRSNRQVEAIYAVMEAGTEPGLRRLVSALLDIARVATSSAVAAMYLLEGGELVRMGVQPEGNAPLANLSPRLPLDSPNLERPRLLTSTEWPGWVSDPGRNPNPHRLELLPLRIQGRLAGMLVLGRTVQSYTADELRTSELLADQIAVQMEKARLLDDARHRVQELDLLLEVGRVVTESLDLDRVLEVAMVSLERMLDCDQAFVWLHETRTGELRGAGCADPAHRARFLATRLKLQQPSGAVRAMLSGTAVRVRSAEGSPLLHQPLRQEFGLRSVLVLPLLHRDEPIGAISVADTRRERSWTDSEVERGTVIARQLAVAVANARLFDDLRRSYDDLARTQAELVKRERLAALGELAAVVAHEVRNPLGVIFNSISSLRRPGLAGADSAMLLQIVGEEADRLNRIVGDLLDFARPHEPELRPEPVAPLLRSVREAAIALAGPGGGTIDIEVASDLGNVLVDARMLRQALINLIVNGVQAMPKGGRVLLHGERSVRARGAGIQICVQDSGPGIAPNAVDRIFEPFFTTKATGTGLGLAVVKRIVDAHRGEVAVDSQEGKGTTFSIWLPG